MHHQHQNCNFDLHVKTQSLFDPPEPSLSAATSITTKIKTYQNNVEHIQPRLISDVDAQHLIANITNDFDTDYFYENLSDGYCVNDLHLHFGERLRDGVGDQRGRILCSHNQVQERKFIGNAWAMRKINTRATPVAYDTTNGGWIKQYYMPTFMCFDVDANKDQAPYNSLFPNYKCYDIHDALDIARPLCIVINPVSGNCQYIYEIRWSEVDYRAFQADKETFEQRYDEVRKRLSWSRSCFCQSRDPVTAIHCWLASTESASIKFL